MSVISCGTHKLAAVRGLLGYSGGRSGWGVALTTHPHLMPRLKKLALTKQNAFKKAVLFHNLTEIYFSCIILRLEEVVTFSKDLD